MQYIIDRRAFDSAQDFNAVRERKNSNAISKLYTFCIHHQAEEKRSLKLCSFALNHFSLMSMRYITCICLLHVNIYRKRKIDTAQSA